MAPSDDSDALNLHLLWAKKGPVILTAVITLVGTIVTALLGPVAVQKVVAAIEREKIRSQLATEVLKTVRELDPQDPRSVTRLGVIAALLADNPDTFHLRVASATTHLDRISRELRDTPLTRTGASIERKDAEIAALEAQQRATAEALARFAAQQASGKAATSPATADAERGQVIAALHALDERTRAMADLLRGSREADEQERRAVLDRLRQVTAPPPPPRENSATGSAGGPRRELDEALASCRQDHRAAEAKLERLGRAWQESAEQLERLRADAAARDSAEARLRDALQALIDRRAIEVRRERGELSVLVPAAELRFDPGRCEPKNPALLAKIADALTRVGDRRFQVRGHADGTGRKRANWELSSCRARGILYALVANGVDEARLSFAGFGSAEPLDAGCTPDALARNRRVEIALLPLDRVSPPGPVAVTPVSTPEPR